MKLGLPVAVGEDAEGSWTEVGAAGTWAGGGVSAMAPGREEVLRSYRAPEFFGEVPIFMGAPSLASVQAKETSRPDAIITEYPGGEEIRKRMFHVIYMLYPRNISIPLQGFHTLSLFPNMLLKT